MVEKPSSTQVSEKPIQLNLQGNTVGLDLDNLVPGAHWRGRYLIREQSADITYGKVFTAMELETRREVLVRSFRVNDDLRERTWFSLTQYKGKALVPLIESGEQDGRRVEIVGAAAGQTLADWAHGRTIGGEELKLIVRQIATLLTHLHELGIVLLNVNLHTVHLEDGSDGPRIFISGLESATDITRANMVSVNVNPFFAPPEAAGLFQHHCGATLRAWDWWSLGRVAQELTLGKHVWSLILDRDVSRHTPELLMRAEQLLKESDHEKPRAGGVEAMGKMDPSLARLLRGLLASNRDGRWGAREVDAWLRGEMPKERYHLPRQERLFVWGDQVFSTVEAAEMFSTAELWDEGSKQIHDQKTRGTLIFFLLDDVGTRKTAERVVELLKLPDSLAFANCSTAAAREVVLGIIWAYLGHGHVPMRCRGQKVDATWLIERLKATAQPEGLERVRAIIEEAAIKQIALVDNDAARAVGDFAHRAQGALLLAQNHHWATAADAKEVAALWSLAQSSDEHLRSIVKDGRERFAVSRDDPLNELFNRATVSEIELIVVAHTLGDPNRFKYVSHDVWSSELYSKLRDEGMRIAKAESWFNLGLQIRLGSHVLGPLPVFLAIWLATGASVALANPSRLTLGLGLSILLTGFLLRGISKKLIQRALRGHDLMWDGILKFSGGNCDQNGMRCVPNMTSVSGRILHLRWLEINRQIGTLHGSTPFAPVPAPARFGFFKTVAAISGLAFAGVLATLGYQVIQHPPTIPALKLAWFSPIRHPLLRSDPSTTSSHVAAAGITEKVNATPDEAAPDAKSETSTVTAAKRIADDPNVLHQMSWTYTRVDDVQHVTIVGESTASPVQTEAALRAGQAAAKPYRASTISGLIAVQVPMDDGIGLMVYDGQGGKVGDKHVYRIGYVPLARSWLQLGDHRAIYLGEN